MILFRLFLMVASLCLLCPSPARAADTSAPAAPVAATPAPPGGLVFIELFSAERCPFCPQAERNMSDLLDSAGVLGFTCVVDYFDNGVDGDLAQPFCTTQQDLYIQKLHVGSRYTPQIVLNGRVQMAGYNVQKTIDAIRAERAGGHVVAGLTVMPAPDRAGSYDVSLPALKAVPAATLVDEDRQPAAATRTGTTDDAEDYVLRVIIIRRQSQFIADENSRQSRERTPRNVAVAIHDAGFWHGDKTTRPIDPPRDKGGDAFIVIVQDRKTGAVVAAAEHRFEKGDEKTQD